MSQIVFFSHLSSESWKLPSSIYCIIYHLQTKYQLLINQTLIACPLLPPQQQHQPILAGPTTWSTGAAIQRRHRNLYRSCTIVIGNHKKPPLHLPLVIVVSCGLSPYASQHDACTICTVFLLLVYLPDYIKWQDGHSPSTTRQVKEGGHSNPFTNTWSTIFWQYTSNTSANVLKQLFK